MGPVMGRRPRRRRWRHQGIAKSEGSGDPCEDGGRACFKKMPRKPPLAPRRPARCWRIGPEMGLHWASSGGPSGEGGARKGSLVLPLEMITRIGIFIGICLNCQGAQV